MVTGELISLARDCEAVLIPSGEAVRLAAGTQVRITQSLGGSFTILTDRGSMARISGKDGDALGLQSASASAVAPAQSGERAGAIEQEVWEQLRSCFDPEIPVNIVELGLIYGCTVTPLEGGGYKVEVRFTLTAPGCGMGQVLREDIKSKMAAVAGVREVAVDLVWEPAWDQSRISHEAKVELGIE